MRLSSKLNFIFLSLSHDVRIDMKAFTQWGCGSDILPVGMNHVNRANSCSKWELSFYSYVL
jgi:hypothetical protein